jgi:hypothetical protein
VLLILSYVNKSKRIFFPVQAGFAIQDIQTQFANDVLVSHDRNIRILAEIPNLAVRLGHRKLLRRWTQRIFYRCRASTRAARVERFCEPNEPCLLPRIHPAGSCPTASVQAQQLCHTLVMRSTHINQTNGRMQNLGIGRTKAQALPSAMIFVLAC